VSDREEAEVAFANFLIERIRQDKYPSVTQMNLLEQAIPRPLILRYVNVLLEKVAEDNWPSNPMLKRLNRVIDAM
jgi:hypothetical protein